MDKNKQNPMIDQMLKLAEMADVLTKKQAKEFVTLLMDFAVKQKNDLAKSFTEDTNNLTKEVYKKIQDALFNISQKHADALLEVRQLTNKQKKSHEDAVAKIELLMEEVKSLVPKDGLDGYTPVKGLDYFDGKDGSPDTRQQIVDKINSGKDKDTKIEAKQITGLPEFTREVVREVGSTFQTETPLKAGANITITKDASGANVITGSAGGSGHTIEDEGTPLTQRTNLNFVGTGVAVTDDAGNDATIVTISSGGGTIDGSGTTNELTYWVDTDTLGSLTTATYPSLTELSYVKGVTSSIQTQLNALTTAYTFAGVSALSTDATKSLYTMTSSVPVEFRSSDGNTILYIDETNERINIGGTTYSYVAPLQITSAVSGPGGFNTGLVLRGAAPSIVFEDTSSNDAMIGVENGDMFFYTGSTASTPMFAIRPGQPNTIFYMNTIWGTDNTYDIGASGASRPRTGYFGTSIIAGATGSTGRVDLKRSSDGTTVGSLIAQTSSINLQGNTVTIGVNTTNGIYHATNGTWMGKGSISNSAPTALVHIPTTGSTAANNGQFKLESQTVLATSEAGLLENDGTHLYFTFANGGTRYQLDQQSGTPGGSNKQFQYNNSSAFAGSANLTQETNQILITASSTSVIPLVVQSTSSSQTSSLFEVQRYDGVAGLAVSATTEVTLGGSYDYVNAKHAAQHIVRYANSGYSGAGLKLQNLSSGSIVRLHSFNNGLYLTNDTGTAAAMTLGTRTNPGDSSTFIASDGRWIIDSGAFVVNKSTWSGNNQFEVTSTARPQLALFYDTSNYLSTTINSTGSATFDLTGTSPTFTFSKGVSISGTLALGANSLTMTGSIAATGARVTKGWFTDIESTNMPTVGGTAILTSLTAPSFTTVELGAGGATDTTLSRASAGVLAVEGVTIPTISSTSTITNKRNQPRITSAASYTTDTGSSLDVSTTDIFIITAQAGALKFNNPGGTPQQGEKLIIRIKDNGTARALTWDTQFRAMGTALPSTTVLSKTLYLGFFYNSTDTKWDLVASAQEA